jgi:thiamine-phosphate pyrophosphorylase
MSLNHKPTARRKFRRAARTATTHLPPGLPGLVYLTDPARRADPAATVRQLPPGSGVIYRHFGAPERADMAALLAALSARRGLVFLIGGDPDLARSVGADGVHWPEARRLEARRWDGAFALQTVSAHSREALSQAARQGFDAALLSTAFPSASPSAGVARGAVRLRILARQARLPVYGLGGITAANADRLSPHLGLAAIGGLDALA